MKKSIIFIFFLFIAIHAMAQRKVVNNLTTFDDKRLHFGFSLGINTFDLGIKHFKPISSNPRFPTADLFPDVTDLQDALENWGSTLGVEEGSEVIADLPTLVPGFSVAIITSLRLHKYFNLRFLPGMSFGERRLVFNYEIDDPDNPDGEFFSIKSTYLDFPLLIKYKSNRINNQKPYLIGGGAYRIDISKTGKEELVPLKKGSFYAEFGVGWDTYLQFFRFSTELKVSLGLNNIIGDSPDLIKKQFYHGAFSEVTSNVFTISFHFE